MPNFMNGVVVALKLLFSIGWLVPIWISVNSLFSFLGSEIYPLLQGKHPLNSFPFLDFSFQAFTIGCVWLSAVLIYWIVRLERSKSGKD
jgi:hypothetical protein